ncbi:MAG TPA: hypothetical protein VF855_13380 [Acidimicrobiales bacterium]
MTMAVAALVAGLAVVAALIALVLRRQLRADPPEQVTFEAPSQLDRRDFARPEAEWLVVVFSSSTCHTCADVVRKAKVLECTDVAVDDCDVTARQALHHRYAIDAVPIAVVADRDGTVRASFIGPVTATDLWAAVAELRYPGRGPEPQLGCANADRD